MNLQEKINDLNRKIEDASNASSELWQLAAHNEGAGYEQVARQADEQMNQFVQERDNLQEKLDKTWMLDDKWFSTNKF